jgi:putative transposase
MPGSRRRSRRCSAGPWQRCSVHFLREALGHVRKDQQGMVAALLRPLFHADDGHAARELVGDALERLRKPLPKVAALLEEAEEDLLAFYCFPAQHWPKLRSTNPLERVNREIGRRTDVVGIFPNDRSLIRLAASVVIEQNDEWLVGHRYLSNHSLEAILDSETKDNNREETRELTAA